jgi:hypothetical protein
MAKDVNEKNPLFNTVTVTQKSDFNKPEEVAKKRKRLDSLDIDPEQKKINDELISQKVLKGVIETNYYRFVEPENFGAISEEIDGVTKTNLVDLALFNPSLMQKAKMILKMGDSEECVIGILDSCKETSTKVKLYAIAIIRFLGEPEIQYVPLSYFRGHEIFILLKITNPPVKIIEKDQRFEKEKRNQRKKSLIFSVPLFSPGYYP